jgi:hypothetical protein
VAWRSQLAASGPTRFGRRFVLGSALSLALTGGGAPADERTRAELTGACYCRAAEELRCITDLTERDCRRRSTEDLCDEWFWLDRRPCWNWGYGG